MPIFTVGALSSTIRCSRFFFTIAGHATRQHEIDYSSGAIQALDRLIHRNIATEELEMLSQEGNRPE